MASDLHFLPDSHTYYHTFMPLALSGFSPREGGVIIALRRNCGETLDPVLVTVLRTGRIMALRLALGGDVLHTVIVHMDLALPPRSRQACLREICRYLHQHAGEAAVVVGDWNFLHADESRLRHGADEVQAGRAESDAFDSMFQDLGEPYQPLMSFALGAPGTRTVQSRIDRWYTNISELDLGEWLVTAAVRGSLQERNSPSDHIPVVVSTQMSCAEVAPLAARPRGARDLPGVATPAC